MDLPKVAGQAEKQVGFTDTTGAHDEVKDGAIEMFEDPTGIIPPVVVSV